MHPDMFVLLLCRRHDNNKLADKFGYTLTYLCYYFVPDMITTNWQTNLDTP